MAVTLPFRRLEPFGVEIERDLAEPLAPSEAYHFADLFQRHGLVLARGQALSDARRDELLRRVGPAVRVERGMPSGSVLSFADGEGKRVELALNEGDMLFWDSNAVTRDERAGC